MFRGVADSYDAAEESTAALADGVRVVEEWARIHASPVTGTMPAAEKLDAIRQGWLTGRGLRDLNALAPDAAEITREIYGYQLPWIIHAAAQQIRCAEEADKADTLAKIALLVEIGVPTSFAARIFLAGVRSRAAASELAALGIAFGSSISEISRNLRSDELVAQLRPLVSPATGEWLALMVDDAHRQQPQPVPELPAFTLKGSEGADILHARKHENRVFLTTVDGRIRLEITPTDEFPFDKVANDPRVAFVRVDETWNPVVRDPRIGGSTEG